MTNDDTANEARKGLFDSVAGKAKEMTGAITGNDTLTEEGQLQQASAHARREANSNEAIADAHAEQAAQELRESQQQTADERRIAYEEAGREQRTVKHTAAAERVSAEVAAQRQEQLGRAQATAAAAQDVRESVIEAQVTRAEADATERDAQREHDALIGEATMQERRAAGLRAEADNL
jgi:uncharacterized protein YjbJ (UPF0337 family)